MIIFHCQTLGGLQEGCGANPAVEDFLGRLLLFCAQSFLPGRWEEGVAG